MTTQRLKTGTSAPAYTAKDIDGVDRSLQAYQGQKLMLAFFRYAACPLCNLRVRELVVAYPKLQQEGLNIVAVFASDEAHVRDIVGKADAPFPIVADPDMQLYDLFHIEYSMLKYVKAGLKPIKLLKAYAGGMNLFKRDAAAGIIPADFLIGPDGTIEDVYVGADIGDHMPIEQIRAWLNR